MLDKYTPLLFCFFIKYATHQKHNARKNGASDQWLYTILAIFDQIEHKAIGTHLERLAGTMRPSKCAPTTYVSSENKNKYHRFCPKYVIASLYTSLL